MDSYKAHITYAAGPHYTLDPHTLLALSEGSTSRLEHTSLIPGNVGERKWPVDEGTAMPFMNCQQRLWYVLGRFLCAV